METKAAHKPPPTPIREGLLSLKSTMIHPPKNIITIQQVNTVTPIAPVLTQIYTYSESGGISDNFLYLFQAGMSLDNIPIPIPHGASFMYFAIAALLVLYPIYSVSINLSVYPAFALVIYFLFPNYYLESFSIVRNCIAYSMVFYAYYKLYNNNKLLSVVFIIIAFLFHKSALIGVFIYPIYYFRQSFKVHIIAFAISFFISVVIMTLIGHYADAIPLLASVVHYADEGRSGGGSMTIIINFIAIVNLLLWKRLEEVDSRNAIYLAFFNIGTMFWNVFIGVDSTIALRMASYFQIFIILLVPQYCYAVNERYSTWVNRGAYSFFLLLFATYFFINVSSYLKEPDRMSNLPYQTIFWHKDYTNYIY